MAKKEFTAPYFAKKATTLQEGVDWANEQDVSTLRHFFLNKPSLPIIAIGSGGSLSKGVFLSYLTGQEKALTTVMTPLEFRDLSGDAISGHKVLLISESGRNKDIENAARKALKFRPENVCALTLTKKNKLTDLFSKYPTATIASYDYPFGRDGFVSSKSHAAYLTLLYRIFNDKVQMPEVPYAVYKGLDGILNFVVLYSPLGKSAALDFESKTSEAGLGCSLLADYRNFCHGRSNFLEKVPDTAIVAFITPKDRALAEAILSKLPPVIKVYKVTASSGDAQAAIELLFQSYQLVLALGIARGIDPERVKHNNKEFGDYVTELFHLPFAKLY